VSCVRTEYLLFLTLLVLLSPPAVTGQEPSSSVAPAPAATPALAAAALAAQTDEADTTDDLETPLEIRDEHVLAQGRLTLPAVGPEPVGRGVTRVRAAFLWGNSFSWTQEVAGENPGDRRFLIDGETRTLDVTLTRGLSGNVDLSLRVPLRWRGGGSLDGFIDAWHDLVAFLGVQDGGRPSFRRDAFRVEGLTSSGGPFRENDRVGLGLGNLEVAGRLRLRPGRTAVALIGRASLPTATAPFQGSWGAGLQLVVRRSLGGRLDLHTGVGGTLEGEPSSAAIGFDYESARAHGFAALVYRPWPKVALSLETNVASRLVRDIDRYPGLHWLINGGLKVPVVRRAVLEVGLTENLKNQASTTDFALYVAATVRP
jgi:hypothetical protein